MALDAERIYNITAKFFLDCKLFNDFYSFAFLDKNNLQHNLT